jgi:hypothetical protein
LNRFWFVLVIMANTLQRSTTKACSWTMKQCSKRQPGTIALTKPLNPSIPAQMNWLLLATLRGSAMKSWRTFWTNWRCVKETFRSALYSARNT